MSFEMKSVKRACLGMAAIAEVGSYPQIPINLPTATPEINECVVPIRINHAKFLPTVSPRVNYPDGTVRYNRGDRIVELTNGEQFVVSTSNKSINMESKDGVGVYFPDPNNRGVYSDRAVFTGVPERTPKGEGFTFRVEHVGVDAIIDFRKCGSDEPFQFLTYDPGVARTVTATVVGAASPIVVVVTPTIVTSGREIAPIRVESPTAVAPAVDVKATIAPLETQVAQLQRDKEMTDAKATAAEEAREEILARLAQTPPVVVVTPATPTPTTESENPVSSFIESVKEWGSNAWEKIKEFGQTIGLDKIIGLGVLGLAAVGIKKVPNKMVKTQIALLMILKPVGKAWQGGKQVVERIRNKFSHP